MAAITASPRPFAASYHDPSRHALSRQDLRRPASRPHLTRGAPLASSVNNPPIQPWSFQMGDSSDDEIPVPPMKFSAEVKSLLGDEALGMESSPSQKKEDVKPVLRLDRPLRKQSPLALGGRFRERTASQASSRSGSPRIVRLNASMGAPNGLVRTVSSFNVVSPLAQQKLDLITPAPRSRMQRPNSPDSLSAEHIEATNHPWTVIKSSAGSEAPIEPMTASKDQSSMNEAEAQMNNLSINRTRVEDMGAQTGQRQKRVQVTGRFLRGPARRGMKRRQSEEDQSPQQDLPPSGDRITDSSVAPQSEVADTPPDPPPIDEAPLASKSHEEQRPPHVRFQSQASIVTGSPNQRHHELIKEPLVETTECKPRPAIEPRSSSKRSQPIFKLPPMPLLPSRFDQENDPPPTFKRNKIGSAVLGVKDKFSIAQDDKMSVQTPATVSPSRPPLAARSQNTPHRPPPPPPKMSVLETATAPAGAASASQAKKKRNFMSVNGKMFTRMDCIGRGGSSKVYRVMAENYKTFALKRVTLEDQDELAIRGYKGEIDLLKQLKDVDRVVSLFDFEINEEKQTLSVLMEIGETDFQTTLKQYLDAEDAVCDFTWTRYFWKEMLECVAAVHARSIVHSDLKPANFVLVKGRLKLIDFGISNAIANDTINVHREQHVGTPNYMSPEALIDSNAANGLPSTETKLMKLGKPSDIWSLGCILYQIVYGKPPFAHITNQVQRCMAIPNPRHVISFPEKGVGGATVPFGLMRTLKRCLTRDQTQRPTLEELLGPNDPFLNPDAALVDAIPVGTELLARLQQNILRHVQERGMPSDEELKAWPEKFFTSIKAAIEEGRA